MILENVNDLIEIINKNFIIEFVNEYSCFNLLGYTPNEVIEWNIIDFVHHSDKERGTDTLLKGLKTKQETIEIRARHKNGNYVWFEVKGKVLIDKNFICFW